MLMARTREQEALVPILERIRVPRDGVLVVHSAIAVLSRQGYRAEAMIEALVAYLDRGTLLMPTMTWRTVTPQNPQWDELATASETGVMTEIFRTRYASRRSIHPTHSVAAHGAATDALTARHHLDDTPVSANSPYGLMRSYRSYVILIGVGLEACTAIHLPEELIAPDVYLRAVDKSETYACRDRHGRVHHVRTRRHWRLDRDFAKFGPALEQRGLMNVGAIQDCPYAIVALGDLLGTVSAALRTDRLATLRNHPPAGDSVLKA